MSERESGRESENVIHHILMINLNLIPVELVRSETQKDDCMPLIIWVYQVKIHMKPYYIVIRY